MRTENTSSTTWSVRSPAELFNLNGLASVPWGRELQQHFAPGARKLKILGLQLSYGHEPVRSERARQAASGRDRHHLRSGDVLVRPTGVGCQLGVG